MNDAELIDTALDPRRSVVVEACAGSGKTWLLVSRILRLLLDGVAPGGILAITYTRRAAREIEERLAEWLRLLAVADEPALRDFLRQRGIAEPDVAGACSRARGLYEQVLCAEPAMTVSTFHGWFARLVQGAPLTSDLAGFVLHESGNGLQEEVWQLFAAERARREDDATRSMLWLLRHVGLEGTRKLMFRLSERRAEWHAHVGAGENGLARALAALRECLGVSETPTAIDRLLADELFLRKLREYGGILGCSEAESDRQLSARLEEACRADDSAARFDMVGGVLLTKEGTPRLRKSVKKDQERFSTSAARFAELHAWLGERVLATRAAVVEEQAWELNVHAFTAGAAWLAALERYKRERRLMDFADLEWQVARLLGDEAQAAFLQARLDARYRHILLDEFQDTNPLQWRILLAWLAAYGSADTAQPGVFVVGDPKQSIYRFRRAEPRVFDHAAAFLQATFRAQALAQDTTRRNASALVDVINRVFADAPDFPHFRLHRSLSAGLPGRVEVLPLCEGDQPMPAPGRMRNPLLEPQAAAEDGRRREEAALLAERVREMVGRWPVIDPATGRVRAARFGDIMVLTRRRGVLPEFERALRAADIPYLSVGRGGLLRTLEANDLTALLRSLVTVGDDLALAQALRTPVLGASDDDLLWLAGRSESGWWPRLQAGVREGAASAALIRAVHLLSSWRVAAARLPVHDLLDRIYHEGDLVARYRAAVPPPMWPGVSANLDAFVALALKLDAGRYPSLPRFLDELARLHETADEAAPDEGTIRAAEAGERVRFLTIHGAKGLEAPIVWLIDAHHARRPPDAWSVLIDWPPEAEHPLHFSVLGRKEDCGARRAPLIEAEETFAAREETNLLYVAMTRARQYLFVSGIASDRAAAKTSFHERIAAALDCLGAVDVYGEAPVLLDDAAEPSSAPSLAPPKPASESSCGRRRETVGPAAAHGTLLHAALEWLSGGGAVAQAPPGVPAVDWPALRGEAEAILHAPGLRDFFDPYRYVRALNECEFALPDGRVGRIDRLVELADAWWVLDYKSGRPTAAMLDSYRAQLAGYREAVAVLFPGKPVRCALITGNGEMLEI
jgi:ATP-dependent helicase/nuclease subunit A